MLLKVISRLLHPILFALTYFVHTVCAQTSQPLLPSIQDSLRPNVSPTKHIPFLHLSSTYVSFSSSYSTSNNWGGVDLANFAFIGNLQHRDNKSGNGRSHAHQLLADLGYQKFVDSIWYKHLDRLQVNLLWNRSAQKWNQSWSIGFNTQFAPSIVKQYNLETATFKDKRVGGFLNPFNLDLGYGAVFTFWQTCNVNFAFATLKFNSSPKETTPVSFADNSALQSDNAYYFMSYGFSLTTAIKKPFGQHVEWLNTTRFFGNGLDKDHVNLDLSNMVIVKLWKYLQLRLDTRLAYNPLMNYDMQFRQEVLLGFFYERQK